MFVRTWRKCTPECASNHSLLQSGQVYMPSQPPILEGLFEFVIIYLILSQKSDQNCKVIMAVYIILVVRIFSWGYGHTDEWGVGQDLVYSLLDCLGTRLPPIKNIVRNEYKRKCKEET